MCMQYLLIFTGKGIKFERLCLRFRQFVFFYDIRGIFLPFAVGIWKPSKHRYTLTSQELSVIRNNVIKNTNYLPKSKSNFIQNLDFLAQFFVYLWNDSNEFFLKTIYIVFILYIIISETFIKIDSLSATPWNFKTNLSCEPVKNSRYNIHGFDVIG